MALFLHFFDFPQDHQPYAYIADLVFESCEGSEHNQIVVLFECFHCFRAALLHIGKNLSSGIGNDAGNWIFFSQPRFLGQRIRRPAPSQGMLGYALRSVLPPAFCRPDTSRHRHCDAAPFDRPPGRLDRR
jgi:hypothetical protein